MGFGRHSKNLDGWIVTQNRFWSPSKNLDCWMMIEMFWSPTIESGKGACNIFLESSH
jgi:hypothetical protein